MKISIYTAMRDCIRHDYPHLDVLRHHLPLADEIVINEGFSTDGTYESIKDFDPKVRVFQTKWKAQAGEDWWIHFKDAARLACTGDWCILLDADEFIPEWEFTRIREHLERTTETLVPVKFVNFYGNCRIYHADPGKSHWVTNKMIIHRNLPNDIELWGDASNVRLKGREFSFGETAPLFTVHHVGGVRDASKLRELWWLQGRFRTGRSVRWKPPRWVFDLFPMKWTDNEFLQYLAIYDGPLVKAVRDNPARYARDNFELLRVVSERVSKANGFSLT